jgi:hypothetical protein
MSLLKYIERVRHMDELIRRGATGNASEFARKLKISESQLFLDLKELKELGAPIEYSSIRRSYFYTDKCELNLNFRKNTVGGTRETCQLEFVEYEVFTQPSQWTDLHAASILSGGGFAS